MFASQCIYGNEKLCGIQIDRTKYIFARILGSVYHHQNPKLLRRSMIDCDLRHEFDKISAGKLKHLTDIWRRGKNQGL